MSNNLSTQTDADHGFRQNLLFFEAFKTIKNWLFTSVWLREYSEFLLTEIDTSWSRSANMARVFRIETQTEDTQTFWLQPQRPIHYQAGQHILIHPVINGVRQTRCYTLSSAPYFSEMHFGQVAITVKRQPNGLVSNRLHDHLRIGDTLELGSVGGEFTLPDSNQPLLMLAGGSGITPFLSMLTSEAVQTRNVTLIYFANEPGQWIGHEQLSWLSAALPHFNYVPLASEEVGHISEMLLSEYVPDAEDRQWMLCGPAGFMKAVHQIANDRNMPENEILQEQFTLVPTQPAEQKNLDSPVEITFTQSNQTLSTTKPADLLSLAESSGLRPKHGCRVGVCHECSCQKSSGIVRNRLTGKLSGGGEEAIQLCISEPVTSVEIAL